MTDHTIPWTNAWKIDLADELNSWWFVWIIGTAVHFKGINSVLVDALRIRQFAGYSVERG